MDMSKADWLKGGSANIPPTQIPIGKGVRQ
jgi:hypothetical protein